MSILGAMVIDEGFRDSTLPISTTLYKNML